MARNPTPAPPLTFEPNRFYEVTLARSTDWKGKTYRRGRDLQFRGDVCEQLRADIATASVIPDSEG